MSRKKIYRPELSTASDARAVRTREALRSALLKLLETRSLDQITIRDIAAEAEVGYTTFFRHHLTKEALLNDLAAEQIERLIGLALPLFEPTDTRASCVALCTYVSEHRELWSTLLTGGAAGAMRDEFLRITREIASNIMEQPLAWLPPDLGTVMTVSSTIELLAWWLRQAKPMPVDQVAEIFHRMVVQPMMDKDRLPKSPAAAAKKSASNRRRKSAE